jgi:hypothetical protein
MGSVGSTNAPGPSITVLKVPSTTVTRPFWKSAA